MALRAKNLDDRQIELCFFREGHRIGLATRSCA
jgi:hypothetical protein